MVNLKGEHIYLRALEPQDLDFIYELENNTDVWEISGTITPYSRHVLRQYLDNAHRDIYDVKQLRLCICKKDKVLGLIDLFDFDPQNKRAGIGIVILDEKDRNHGIGTEAIALICNYGLTTLGLRQVYANVMEDNVSSLHLFKKMGFVEVGTKKDWIRTDEGFKNEVLLQKIKS
ncbi:MAG: GNAT family N-acetyltransferase [Maribacter sp.]|nr:GNAT family N-acetyltransferase [Maribacter sp.]NNK19169.1 GNAT family N-acetyltransferase [Maribacter sp.]